jgi:GNAT superfamily N-acetyltransferase
LSIQIREARTAKERRQFIFFPEKLYEKRYPQWVHPIYVSEREFFNPGKNHSWKFCDGALFLAWRDGKTVGRIMAMINHKVNRVNNEATGRFGFFDCVNDREVAARLLNAAEEWVAQRECNRIVGPLGFTDLDCEGMLVEGFEHRATITTWWHPPYTPSLIEEAGYRKEIDWVTYLVDVTSPLPEVYLKVADRIKKRGEYALVEFSKRSQLKTVIEPIFKLINETFSELYGFSPLDDEEIRKIAADYIVIIDPRFVKVVSIGGKVVAFTIGIPDMTEGIRAARGRLFPFGIFKILNAGKRTRQLDMLLGGIAKEHRGRGLDVLMATSVFRNAIEAGITSLDSHHELEDNLKVRAEMERLGGKIYKRYRAFAKEL